MRERTTWNRDEILNGALSPWETEAPSEQYGGNLDSWAEDVLPDDSEKTASNQLLVKKADLTIKVARLMLGNKAAEEVVEDQAIALMALPDSDLIETYVRLVQRTPLTVQELLALV